MRMNYSMYPIDYVNELRSNGNRKKSIAFMDYWHDMNNEEHNSIRFYEKAWGVGKSTVARWVKEFDYEIRRFFNHWELKNNAHFKAVNGNTKNKSVKNRVGQQGDSSEYIEAHSKAPKKGSFKESSGTARGQQWDKDFNINDDEEGVKSRTDKWFNDLYFIYRFNTKYAGKKEEAFKEWLKVKDSVGYENMKLAIMMYLHDQELSKRYNFANFLRNEVYLSYLPKRIRILIDGEWMVGTYDDKEHVFRADSGFEGYLSSEALVKKFADKELEFLR